MKQRLDRDKPDRAVALRSTSVIGVASLISVMLGLVKVKFAAVLLGPSGVGLIGLLQSLVASASTLAGMGVTNAGTREVAQALRDRERLCRLRAALFYGTAALASVAAIVVWACRQAIAEEVLGNATHAEHVGWVALAVALTIGSGSQKALIRGMQRSRDIAMVLIWGAAIGMVVGVVGLLALGDHGIFLFIVATPLGSFLAGSWYAKQLPKGEKARGVRAIVSEWHRLLRLGAVLMMAGGGVVLGHLWLRAQIAQVLGVQQLGYFQAAWMVSATYIGFVLTAMGNEYFPRIAASLGMPNRIVDMANQQTEVVFLVGVPILLTAYLFSPVMIRLLFSEEFGLSASLLKLLIVGDFVKLAGFPLRYVVMSSGRGTYFLFSELLPVGLLIATVAGLASAYGLHSAGLGYVAMQGSILLLSLIYVKRKFSFSWDGRSVRILLLSAGALLVSAVVDQLLDGVPFVACASVVLLSIYWASVRRLAVICVEGNIGSSNPRFHAFARWIAKGWRDKR